MRPWAPDIAPDAERAKAAAPEPAMRIADVAAAPIDEAPLQVAIGQEHAAIPTDSVAPAAGRIGEHGGAIHAARIVGRHIDLLRRGRLDDDGAAIVHHIVLRPVAQCACALRIQPQALDGVQHIRLLRNEGVTQTVGPFQMAIHHLQNLRERQQGLHAGIPVVSRRGVGQRGALQPGMGSEEALCLHHLRGVGGGGQDVRQQRVGVERDRRHDLVELRRGQNALRGHRCLESGRVERGGSGRLRPCRGCETGQDQGGGGQGAEHGRHPLELSTDERWGGSSWSHSPRARSSASNDGPRAAMPATPAMPGFHRPPSRHDGGSTDGGVRARPGCDAPP